MRLLFQWNIYKRHSHICYRIYCFRHSILLKELLRLSLKLGHDEIAEKVILSLILIIMKE